MTWISQKVTVSILFQVVVLGPNKFIVNMVTKSPLPPPQGKKAFSLTIVNFLFTGQVKRATLRGRRRPYRHSIYFICRTVFS